MIKIGLIGFGHMGSKYFNEITSSKNFILTKILKNRLDNKIKTKIKIFHNKKKFFLNQKNIDAYIVASPISTHYEYFEKIIKSKKPLIIEKPLIRNIYELNKINKLFVKLKDYPLIVNHTDLFNPAFIELKKKIKLIGRFKKIKINFGKKQNIYKTNTPYIIKPYFDWLPHPIAVSVELAGVPKAVKVLIEKTTIKNQRIYQKMNINLISKKNILTNIKFSNNYLIPKRKIEINGTNGYIKYNAYSNKQLIIKIKNKKKMTFSFKKITPTSKILEFFNNMIKYRQKTNNLSFGINVMKVIFLIQKQLQDGSK
jgi:predicted dehydrogenase